jgi:hypothetical protein
MRGRTIADVTPGLRLGRSWLLIFGVVPFEYDDITIAEVELGRRFLERSSMLSMRLWQHERLITAAGGSCQVRDQITFEFRRPLARAPWLEACLQTWLERLFRHRHKRLVQHFRELEYTGSLRRRVSASLRKEDGTTADRERGRSRRRARWRGVADEVRAVDGHEIRMHPTIEH